MTRSDRSALLRGSLVAVAITILAVVVSQRQGGREASLAAALGAGSASAIQLVVLAAFEASVRRVARAVANGSAGGDEAARSLAGAAGLSAMVRLVGGVGVVFVVLASRAIAPFPFVGGFVAAYVALEIFVDVQLIRSAKVGS